MHNKFIVQSQHISKYNYRKKFTIDAVAALVCPQEHSEVVEIDKFWYF